MSGGGLVKTVRFKNPTYVGDPMNAVRIFNDKGADELVFLDIDATVNARPPAFDYIEQLAGECFMPLGYGGGIRTVEEVRQLTRLGVEKCVLNTAALEDPDFVARAADFVGSQSVVVAIDVTKTLLGKYQTVIRGGRKKVAIDPIEAAQLAASHGAGEIILTAVHQEGMMRGYDLRLIGEVAAAVDVPVVANGGAASVTDFVKAIDAGASAVAAGSMFVFKGPHRAVLINVPSDDELSVLYQVTARH